MNIKDCRGTIRDPMRFNDATNLTAENICEIMKAGTSERGIPANVTVTSIHSGNFLFGSDYPCVMISHPNPPQQYFSLLIIINGNVVSFMFWGNSKANYNHNKKADYDRSGKLFRGMFINDDQMALQTEHAWQASVMDVFDDAIK